MEQESKQVIIVRRDLNMSIGKTASQVAHASMKSIFDRYIKISISGKDVECKVEKIPWQVAKWLDGSFTKIVVAVNSEKELLDLYNEIKDTDIPVGLIRDEGRTELGQPTYTCLGVGPWSPEKINKFTGNLPLYK